MGVFFLYFMYGMRTKYVVFLDGTGGKDTPHDSMLLSFESASFLILEYMFAILCGIVVDTVIL